MPSASAWNQSRGMHKLQDGHISAIDTKRKRPKQSDSSSSDIELFGPTNPTTIDPDTSIRVGELSPTWNKEPQAAR